MTGKSPEAFRSISEAAAELKVEQHVLRFWESQLPFIRPLKRAGGRRFYRPGDLALLKEVQRLRDHGHALSEVRRLHGEGRFTAARAKAPTVSAIAEPRMTPPSSFGTRPTQGAEPTPFIAAYDALVRAKSRLDALLAAR
ncbi:MAG: MerR family transcriptional regulator [Caulobacteraceae bacterium]